MSKNSLHSQQKKEYDTFRNQDWSSPEKLQKLFNSLNIGKKLVLKWKIFPHAKFYLSRAAKDVCTSKKKNFFILFSAKDFIDKFNSSVIVVLIFVSLSLNCTVFTFSLGSMNRNDDYFREAIIFCRNFFFWSTSVVL